MAGRSASHVVELPANFSKFNSATATNLVNHSVEKLV